MAFASCHQGGVLCPSAMRHISSAKPRSRRTPPTAKVGWSSAARFDSPSHLTGPAGTIAQVLPGKHRRESRQRVTTCPPGAKLLACPSPPLLPAGGLLCGHLRTCRQQSRVPPIPDPWPSCRSGPTPLAVSPQKAFKVQSYHRGPLQILHNEFAVGFQPGAISVALPRRIARNRSAAASRCSGVSLRPTCRRVIWTAGCW